MAAALNSPSGRRMLDTSLLTIGSSQDNALVIDNINVSAHHAEIRPEGAGYSITDLGSAHGTFVNGQQLDWNTPRQLSPGDTITIGDTTFTYETAEAPAGSFSAADPDATIKAHYESVSHPLLSPIDASPAQSAYGLGIPVELSQQATPNAANTVYAAPSDSSTPSSPSLPSSATPSPSSPQQGLVPAPQIPYMQPFPQAYYPPGTMPPGYPNQITVTQLPPGYPAMYPPGYVPGYVPAPPPRKRGRLWLWLSVVVAALLIGSALTFFLVTRSTPERTLDTYCNAVQVGDYQSAYNQLALTLQNLETEPQFAKTIEDGFGRVTSCTHSSASTSSNLATASLNVATGTGAINAPTSLVQDSSNTWKISALPTTPTLTMRTFCNALEKGDMDVAYNQLSSDLHTRVSEVSFASSFTGATCTFTPVTESGSNASTTLTFNTTSGAVTGATVLNQDSNSNNDWKISSINFK